MDFAKTEEQQLLLESVEEFLLGSGFNDAYFAEKYNNNSIPVEYFKALVDSGFGLMGIPEEFGGTEVDILTMAMVAEKMASMGYPPNTSAMLQIDDMLAFGNREQLEIVSKYLIENGSSCFCLGLSEPQAGSDTAAIATTATIRNGKVYINGHKTWTTNALTTPYMLCVARDEKPVDPKFAFSMWFIPMNSPGVKVEQLHKIGNKMGSLCEVYLDDVELEESAIVGKEGHGFVQMMKNFEIERLVISAIVLGMATCAYNDAAAYANQRIQFGKSIGSFQLIQEKIVNMAIKINNMRNYVYQCAWEKDNGISIRTSANLCKLYCARSAFEVADDAMQILGGLGYTEDHRVSRLWRDLRMHRIGGGTDEIMIQTAGKLILREFK